MRLNITRLMHGMLPLAVLLLSACGGNHSYTIGGTVTGLASSPGPLSTPLVLQNNGGDNLTISANGAFTFATAVKSNSTTKATYNVTILTQPFPQTCTVTGGSGTASSNVTSVVVSCSSSSTSAYVVNKSGTVSQYPIGANGALPTTAASSVATGATPYSIAVVPSGLYAYVANNFNGVGGNTVSEYTINSGVLTLNTTIASPTGTIAAGTNPVSVTVDPTGPHVYVVNAGSNPGTVSQYSINSDGTLAKMTPATVNAGTTPNSIAVDPSGHYAYVANYGDGTISEYTISSGVLSANTIAATIPAGTSPASITVDPTGKYAYVANYGDGTVSEYNISSADGTLTAMTPGTVTAGTNPISVTVSGSHVYVANHNYNTSNIVGSVSEYSIGASGVLGVLTGIGTVGTGVEPSSITVDPTGSYAYVANLGDGTVSQYTINSDGTLAAMTPATVTVGGQPISVITAR
jgi:6-phosphogluconolactonase